MCINNSSILLNLCYRSNYRLTKWGKCNGNSMFFRTVHIFTLHSFSFISPIFLLYLSTSMKYCCIEYYWYITPALLINYDIPHNLLFNITHLSPTTPLLFNILIYMHPSSRLIKLWKLNWKWSCDRNWWKMCS